MTRRVVTSVIGTFSGTEEWACLLDCGHTVYVAREEKKPPKEAECWLCERDRLEREQTVIALTGARGAMRAI